MTRAATRARARGRSREAIPGPSAGVAAPGRERLITVLVIVVGTCLAYANSLDGSFQLDDRILVAHQGLRDLGSLWSLSGTRWLGYVSFALNYRVGGLDVSGYHLANLVIHVCNALLVAGLASVTLRTPAMQASTLGSIARRYLPLAAGLLFAVHPVQTQAVTYVVQRFASLATLFFLLSAVLYVRARLLIEEDGPSRRTRVVGLTCLSVLSAAAAMKTKEISVTLPVVLVAYELLFFGWGRRLLLAAPIAATTLLVPMALAKGGEKLTDVLAEASRYAVETQDISRSEYLLTQTRVVWTYLRLLVLPLGQNLDYGFRISRSLAEPSVLLATLGLLAFAGVSVLLLVRARRARRAPGTLAFFGLTWFFVTLSVESSVIPIRDVIFEHRVYLPSVGAAITLAITLLVGLERLRLHLAPALQVAGVLAITAGPLGIATYLRNVVWKDEVTLWRDVVAKSPLKPRPRNNLACAYQAAGDPVGAEREAREAIRLAPGYADAHVNLGNALQSTGRREDAIRAYREASRLDPGMAEPRNNLCFLYLEEARLEEALAECLEARRLGPGLADARNNLGNVLLQSARGEEAMREYREAIRLAPGFADPHRNLAFALLSAGRADEAIEEYVVALRLRPGDARARTNLGVAYQARGDLDAAMREYREAVRLDPALQIARDNLAAVTRAIEQRAGPR
jgi:tetratricopeptide (TPR) repeat protein